MHCDHTVHFSRIEVYGWIVQCSGHPDTKARPPNRLFPVSPGREVWGGNVQARRSIVYREERECCLHANTDK